jgi:hypothetical protein
VSSVLTFASAKASTVYKVLDSTIGYSGVVEILGNAHCTILAASASSAGTGMQC